MPVCAGFGYDKGKVGDSQILISTTRSRDFKGFECNIGFATAFVNFCQGDAQCDGAIGANIAKSYGAVDYLTDTAHGNGTDIFSNEVTAVFDTEFPGTCSFVGTVTATILSCFRSCCFGCGADGCFCCVILILATGATATGIIRTVCLSVHKIALSFLLMLYSMMQKEKL